MNDAIKHIWLLLIVSELGNQTRFKLRNVKGPCCRMRFVITNRFIDLHNHGCLRGGGSLPDGEVETHVISGDAGVGGTSQALAPLGRRVASRAGLMLKLEESIEESREPQRLSSRALIAFG